MTNLNAETRSRVEAARQAHNAAVEAAKWWKPWRWLKTHETSADYRLVLYVAALEEMQRG